MMALPLVLSAVTLASQAPVPFAIAGGTGRTAGIIRTTVITLQLDAAASGAVETVRLVRLGNELSWREAGRSDSPPGERLIRVEGAVGLETLLVIRIAGQPGYLLDGPFRWPSQPATYHVGSQWRKTIRGRFSGSHTSLVWVSPDADRITQTRCVWTGAADWECAGVPLDAVGVVIAPTSGEVRCGIPGGVLSSHGIDEASTRVSAWGRLVAADRGASSEPEESPIRMTPRRLEVPRARPSTARVSATVDRATLVLMISEGVAWVSGGDLPNDGWLEVAVRDRATERIDLKELAAAPPELPFRVQLQPPASLFGRVVGARGASIPDTDVALFRLEPDGTSHERPSARRIMVQETRTDADGGFHFRDLAVEPYELVAIHGRFGRGVRRVTPDGRQTDVTLRAGARVVGRVLRDGRPSHGVPVVVVPDLFQFAAASDPTDVRGGETRTDEDGRFEVAAPARGSSELRIGDERTGVRRVPLGQVDVLSEILDVGDLELGRAATVTFVLEGDGSCEILMTGPSGRTGMSVLRATRFGPAISQVVVPEPGRWHVAAVCGAKERAVIPSWIDVGSSARDVNIRLTWPQ